MNKESTSKSNTQSFPKMWLHHHEKVCNLAESEFPYSGFVQMANLKVRPPLPVRYRPIDKKVGWGFLRAATVSIYTRDIAVAIYVFVQIAVVS